MEFSRRDFIVTATMASLAARARGQAQSSATPGAQPTRPPVQTTGKGFGTGRPPILVSSANGWNGIDIGYQMVRDGKDTLDAAIAVGKVQEDDPNDSSVGYGGLPNEEGVVELDSSCMHGPTRRAGAVGGVRNIKNVALLAQAVMNNTGHVMLVGEGAERFGYAMGFEKMNLLTERSRKTWMLWKETHSNQDWWGPGLDDPNWQANAQGEAASAQLQEEIYRRLEELAARLGIEPEYRQVAIEQVLHPPHGTIHCSALNDKAEISGMTTTSGLAWKLPGRCGDTPIIGAGCYTDQDVGSAGATGSGEENIRVAGAHSIVENMRKGMSPQEAGLDVLKRIARNFNNDQNKLRYVSMNYYILRKDGAYAGVSMWSGRLDRPSRFCVHDGQKRLEPCVALFQGTDLPYPPRTPQPRPNVPNSR
ncbi:MAG TPA: N(4)-(beta-N-acetylglucosaminyl)-L-asparaginase [Terriglobales bacterium]|nr:N(4)-(beta-N-acetylglucosaminyl)-L-asparaginase [Terriglobales bacterium]